MNYINTGMIMKDNIIILILGLGLIGFGIGILIDPVYCSTKYGAVMNFTEYKVPFGSICLVTGLALIFSVLRKFIINNRNKSN